MILLVIAEDEEMMRTRRREAADCAGDMLKPMLRQRMTIGDSVRTPTIARVDGMDAVIDGKKRLSTLLTLSFPCLAALPAPLSLAPSPPRHLAARYAQGTRQCDLQHHVHAACAAFTASKLEK